ncbi:MAG: Stp1/IreP family PP2C-type Ser/Thr phosphatase [Actinobacteria bacterium]|nr:Stp1/IreP family PP2C-type Ser/Thr phosphatase [Actinomycetota bacterium]
MAALHWGAATHEGRVRDANEDAYVAEPMVFVVADGMGGHQAGEVASALAAGTLRDRLQGGATSVDVVVAAVVEANAAIFQTAHINAAQRGMGTTLTAIAVLPAGDGRPDQFAIVNVGDSRVYLARSGELTRATVDHSYVQELLATGHINEAEARAHPRRNIVTRALGIEPTVRVDSWLMPLVRADRFVLCSDGLVDEVDDEEIHRIILANAQPQACADALVATAVANGGRDNVTVIVVDVVDGLDPDAVAGIPADATDDDTVQLTRSMTLGDAAVPPTLENPVVESKIQQQLGRQMTVKTFLLLLLGAVVVTVVIVVGIVALTGDDTPDPAPTTTVVTTVAPTTTAPATTAPATTTTRPTTTTTIRPTTTTSAGTTTVAP